MIPKKKLGMSLVEVLVAIVIGVISAAAIFYSYNIFNKSYQSVVDKAKISSSSRNALSMILKDLRNSGYCDINYNNSCERLIINTKLQGVTTQKTRKKFISIAVIPELLEDWVSLLAKENKKNI